MTLQEIQYFIEKAGIPKDLYCIGEEYPNEAYCIYLKDGNYCVYYAERGNKQCEKKFESAEMALDYLMPLLVKYKKEREDGRAECKGITAPVVAQVEKYNRIMQEVQESKREPTSKEKMTIKSTERLLSYINAFFKKTNS